MKTILSLLILLFIVHNINAQDSMKITMNEQHFVTGDSILWQCELNGFDPSYNAVTLNLWIENVATGVKYQYRFPVVNKYAAGAIHIDGKIPNGKYAFNYVLQHDFFNVTGKVKYHKAKDTALQYFVLFKDKETLIKNTKMDAGGAFRLRGLLFQDTAMFAFSIPKKHNDNLFIDLKTSLDSTFIPAIPIVTKFVAIGVDEKNAATNSPVNVPNYKFDIGTPKQHQLSNVVIREKRIEKATEYDKEYVTGMFRSADDITFDGLDNDDILKSGDIYNYLSMHVAGLTVLNDPSTGTKEIKWRGSTTTIYVDEFRVDPDIPLTVEPGEVALIKVFRPGSTPNGGNGTGGAIAIYTKIGPYASLVPSSQHSRFYLHGYDAFSMDWD